MKQDSGPRKRALHQCPPCRPRNAEATRAAILNAALNGFTNDGYDQVGLRAIARDAGVDAALIHRYFGCKEQLFACVLAASSRDPMAIVAGDRASFGERMAQAMVEPGQSSLEHRAFMDMITHSASSPKASELVHQHIERQFLTPFTAWLGDAKAREKAWLVAATLLGVAIMRDIEPASCASYKRLATQLQYIIDSP